MLLLSPGEVTALNHAQLNNVQWGQTAEPGLGLREGPRGCAYRAGHGEGDPEPRVYEVLRKCKAQPVLPVSSSSSSSSKDRCRAGRILHPPPLRPGLHSKHPTVGVQGLGGPRAGWDPSGSEGSPQAGLPKGLAFREWRSGDVFGNPRRH